MEKLRRGWKRTPDKIRRPTTLVIGLLFVLASGSIGWLPGPGGIPLFLIGIAILASEFSWAERFRDWILERVHIFGAYFRKHPVVGWLAFAGLISFSLTMSYLIFFRQ